MNNSFRAITNEDLIRKYDLDKLITDRKRISTIDNKLTYTDGILTNFVEQTVQDIENIQDQLDGNITSWFSTGVPTLNNFPAEDWTTTALKDEHLGDLYYDDDAGTAYRFIYDTDNQIYKWNQLTDDAAALALSTARAAKDTADQKRRVFVVQPIPPYDVGDLWWNTTNSELYRCIVAEDEEGTFHSIDWVNSLKYTDDSTAIRLNLDLKDEVAETYTPIVDFTRSNESINIGMKALRVVVDKNCTIYRETPTVPYNVGDVYIDEPNGNVYRCITAKTSEQSYSSSDWVIDLELTEYVSQAGVQIFKDAINMEVKGKVGDDELISKINMSPEQIAISSNKISLAGKTIQMTSDNIAINSDHFQVTKEGNVTCQNLTATNANISGYINATSGTIGGAQIVNNTLKIGNINVDTINGDKVQGGTLNGYNVNITNVNGDYVNRGTINGNNVSMTNLSASNIQKGTLSKGQISYRYDTSNGQAFLQAGPDFSQHPYVSALNMAYGHGGISFRSTDASGQLGSQIGYIRTTSSSSALYIDANNGVNINQVKFYDNYVHAGNLSFGGQYVTADSGDLNLNTKKSGKYVYANGTRIGGSPSERKTKTKIKKINNKTIEQLIDEIRELPTYSYDYKKSYCGEKDNLGFMIDDLKENAILTKALHIIEYNGAKKYNHDDLSQIDFVVIKELINKIDKLESEIEDLKERIGGK